MAELFEQTGWRRRAWRLLVQPNCSDRRYSLLNADKTVFIAALKRPVSTALATAECRAHLAPQPDDAASGFDYEKVLAPTLLRTLSD